MRCKTYLPKIKIFAIQPVISDSYFCKVNQHDKSDQATIGLYSSATKKIVKTLTAIDQEQKRKNVYMYKKSIDKLVSGNEAYS